MNLTLTLRTDKPDAEIGLYEGAKQLRSHTWHADRQLAKELLATIKAQLAAIQADWPDITGVVVFEGPGSFTGLRIGISMANALAYGQNIPVVAAKGDSWVAEGLRRLAAGENDRLALPHYGSEANITLPKK